MALERFFTRGLPTPRDEDWKYTALDFLEQAGFARPASQRRRLGQAKTIPGIVLRFGNGRLTDVDYDDRSTRMVWPTMPTRALAVRHLGRLADTLPGDAALAEHQQCAVAGRRYCCTCPSAGKPAPLFVAHRASEADAMLHLRHLVVLEAGTEAVLVEHYQGSARSSLLAQQRDRDRAGRRRAADPHQARRRQRGRHPHRPDRGATGARQPLPRLVAQPAAARVVRHDIRVEPERKPAPSASSTASSSPTDGATSTSTCTSTTPPPHTTSRQTWRGIADGRGRGIFDARVVVQPGARKADAQQSSRNLLLSPHAEIDVKPQLEIYTDDVKCGHGATVGQLDEAELFYLRSRGIDADAARALLMRGFAEEALGLLKNTGLGDWLEPHLAAALPVLNKERTA